MSEPVRCERCGGVSIGPHSELACITFLQAELKKRELSEQRAWDIAERFRRQIEPLMGVVLEMDRQ